MAEFSISVDLSGVMAAADGIINEQVFPLLSQAVRGIAQQLQNNWQESVHRANLWSGERDAYASSITWKSTGPFSALVQSDYKYDEDIESGRPPYDLKRMLQISQKIRQTKKGKRYLIIPFRHNVPEATGGQNMPAAIYQQASQLTASRIIGQTTRPAYLLPGKVGQRQVMRVNQNQYKWGGRLPEGLAPKKKDFHATDIYSSMVRMDTTTPGGGRYSAHLTFRTMMEGSTKWILPAKEGLHIAERVTADMRPLAEKVLTEALRRTLGPSATG
jgi:hypothetical protein